MTSERHDVRDAAAPSAAADHDSVSGPERETPPRVAEDAAASPDADGRHADHADPAPPTPSLNDEQGGSEDEQGGSEAAEGPGDQEARIEHDLEEILAKAGKADEYLQLAQRTKADFENYRKRAAREAAAAQRRGIVKLAQELLPAVDDLDRAVTAAQAESGAEEDGTGTLVSGIKLVHAGVIAALARVGIEPYSPEGERFDPQHHEAVAQQPIEGTEPGTIVEVYQRGYRLSDGSVLRPARVVVAA